MKCIDNIKGSCLKVIKYKKYAEIRKCEKCCEECKFKCEFYCDDIKLK